MMKNTYVPLKFLLLFSFLASSYVIVAQPVTNLSKDVSSPNTSHARGIPDKGVPLAINALPVASNTYYNSGKITSTGKIVAKSKVEFKSEYAIELKEGFSAEVGSIFHAEIVLPPSQTQKKLADLIHKTAFTHRLYPNPVSESFNLEINAEKEGSAELVVVNALGAVLLTKPYTLNKGLQQFSINANGWAAGLYFVNITMNGIVHSERIVISNR